MENEKFTHASFNWFPGHMAKTIREITEDLKLVDLVIIILDARIPISSRNPEIEKRIGNKDKLYILNKKDLAEDRENDKWISYFENKKEYAILSNSKSEDDVKKIIKKIKEVENKKIEEAKLRGRNKIIRAMIIGIPNSGKSSFINRVSKKKSTVVGNKPGVTRKKQWIRLDENIELLDTPGVLWPKFENEKVANNLSFTGSIKDEILEETELAFQLLKYLIENDYEKNIIERYKLEDIKNLKVLDIMKKIGINRSCLIKGGEVDLTKTSNIILDDFRSGKLGKITLEKVK